MSIIKQISVYDGSSWGINDIGANAGNIDLIAPNSTTTTNLAGSSNLFTALNNILPTSQLTASRALVTNSSKKLDASATTATQLGYVHGVTSNIQTQLDTLNTNLENKFITMIYSGDLGAIAANSSGYITVQKTIPDGYVTRGINTVFLMHPLGSNGLQIMPNIRSNLSGNITFNLSYYAPKAISNGEADFYIYILCSFPG